MKWYGWEPLVRYVREFGEDQWFDRTRKIRTSGNLALQRAGLDAEEIADGEIYQPARPRHIRQALRDIPSQDLSRYNFVDLGSGKGRAIFVAAEFPFQRVIGVELSPLMHAQATANLRSYRGWKRQCKALEAVHANAKDFVFPEGDLVLYMFNPFGRSTMQVVLKNFADAIRQSPRQVVVILLWPRCEDMVAAIDGMVLAQKTAEYQIFSRS